MRDTERRVAERAFRRRDDARAERSAPRHRLPVDTRPRPNARASAARTAGTSASKPSSSKVPPFARASAPSNAPGNAGYVPAPQPKISRACSGFGNRAAEQRLERSGRLRTPRMHPRVRAATCPIPPGRATSTGCCPRAASVARSIARCIAGARRDDFRSSRRRPAGRAAIAPSPEAPPSTRTAAAAALKAPFVSSAMVGSPPLRVARLWVVPPCLSMKNAGLDRDFAGAC
jgi:hypothetical protein